ncbi:MAG: glycosyl hydrolase [Cytophagales bacterium CG17_big_fil_post_rev_8_21_14_2_50_40_13]|nr:MAG: glycosyl hydrolase [Cytophagales bacterium CG17_big_fil_post_rev_8_21_14_2_50_40_13]
MNKWMKTTLKVLGILLLVLVVAGLSVWFWARATFLKFEGDYSEKLDFEQLNINGYTFLDRNSNGQLDPYEDDRKPTAERVADLLSQMTIEEKIHLLKGSGMASGIGMVPEGEGIPGAVGTIVPTPRLGIPTIYLSDGPAGLRIEPKRTGEDRTYYATAFPIGTLMASTWNTALVEQVGQAMGSEAKAYGLDVILGPAANIHRHPLNGRNFEYYSEDPVLTGWIGAAMVNGIESNGVGTSVKHFVANNQETNRNFNDVIVSERALREIYLKGFEIIVEKSQPWTIMSSYNKVNGEYVAESPRLLTDILRKDWGFEGLVMSDWFGGQDAVGEIVAGNDLLEPGTKKQWNALIEGYEDGKLSIESIDTSVKRILKMVIESRKMQNYQYDNNPDLNANAKITRQSASEGMILLKNNDVLPLTNKVNVALLGVNSYDFIAGGTGSGDVNEAYSISLEQGLLNIGTEAKPIVGETDLALEQGQRNAGFEINENAKAIYEAHKAANAKAFVKPEGMYAMFQPYNPPQVNYSTAQLQEMAGTSDVAIITIGRNSGEGGDRVEVDDFLLTKMEKDMIERTCEVFHAAGKKVVVVLNIGGVIETASWKAQPDAILLAWQGGQEGGNSVADILAGNVNPSGKLPMTFPINLNDHWSNKNFPLNGEPMKITSMLFAGEVKEEDKVRNRDYTLYEEGIYVGYRHFDRAGLEVAYPFGYGLSYTDFGFSDLNVVVVNDTINISFSIQNTGELPGKEVAQVYVSKPNSTIDRPEKELKAFAKTKMLGAGETEVIALKVPIKELSYWNESISGWMLEPGAYTIRLGNSSRTIKLESFLEL